MDDDVMLEEIRETLQAVCAFGVVEWERCEREKVIAAVRLMANEEDEMEYRAEGLYRGDCLDWLRSLPDGSVDFIFTDPPYGHNNNNSNGDLAHRWECALGHRTGSPAEERPIANDGPEAMDLFREFMVEAARLLKPGCCCCCCGGGGGPAPQFAHWSLIMDECLGFKHMVVWDKGPMGMGWHYRRSYEVVLVGQKPGAKCAWFDTSHRIENVIRSIRKIIPSAEQHPTQKPVALAEHFIRLHCQPGGLVIDPFLGSGTTAVAAIRLGMRWGGAEMEPTYWPMIEKRVAEAEAEMGQRLPLEFGKEEVH